MDEDPRAVLGVPASVTRAVLKRAFRARAWATHPDHGGDRVAFEATVTAYEALLPDALDDPRPARDRFPSTPPGRPTPTFCVYDSQRAVPRAPARSCPRDGFDDVLAQALAALAA